MQLIDENKNFRSGKNYFYDTSTFANGASTLIRLGCKYFTSYIITISNGSNVTKHALKLYGESSMSQHESPHSNQFLYLTHIHKTFLLYAVNKH